MSSFHLSPLQVQASLNNSLNIANPTESKPRKAKLLFYPTKSLVIQPLKKKKEEEDKVQERERERKNIKNKEIKKRRRESGCIQEQEEKKKKEERRKIKNNL